MRLSNVRFDKNRLITDPTVDKIVKKLKVAISAKSRGKESEDKASTKDSSDQGLKISESSSSSQVPNITEEPVHQEVEFKSGLKP